MKKTNLLSKFANAMALVLSTSGVALAQPVVGPAYPIPPVRPVRPVAPIPPVAPVRPAPGHPTIARVTANALNVRNGPGTRFAVIGTALRGTKLSVQGTRGGWLKVVTPIGVVGWVSSSYTAPVR